MITVHYLKIGRPLFTVWLLEELQLDYKLNVFLRDPETMRAPKELRSIHPLGKSPIIEDGDLMLTETGAITSYLIDTYDDAGNLAPDRADIAARAEYSQWLHYAEGSAFAPLLLTLLLARAKEQAPGLLDQFARSETRLHLDYLSNFIGTKSYLLGDHLTGADFGVGYIVSMASRLQLLGSYPALQQYLARVTSRPAFIRAVEATEEEANF
ncbi:MAG: glutathione S-transferase family protein [Rhizobiaceae bacterium]